MEMWRKNWEGDVLGEREKGCLEDVRHAATALEWTPSPELLFDDEKMERQAWDRYARDQATRLSTFWRKTANCQAEKSAPVNPMKELRIEKLVISAYSANADEQS